MKILIACECSGIVREAFKAKGHDAWSCDLQPTEMPGQHIQGDVLEILNYGWDMMIAHPECTFLAVSGNRWMNSPLYPERKKDREKAIEFFMKMINAPIPKICVENPVGIMSTVYRPPTQYIQPYQFGNPESKKTGLWLTNLPKLKPTNIVEPVYIIGKDGKRYSPIHYMGKGNKKRKTDRSRTYTGIAKAMAEQWNF